MIWFTADTHFDHKAILNYQQETRPFGSVDEMNEALVSRWNAVVAPGDVVYHLGDFAFRNHAHWAAQLRGQIVLVEGSHDGMSAKDRKAFHWAGPLHVVKGDPDIILCHYAMRTWPRSHYGTWHLYGHAHGHLPPHGKSFDVGADAWFLSPISLERVRTKMAELTEAGGVDERYEGEVA
jgi:calcineurin-like phosphoesterase family protein